MEWLTSQATVRAAKLGHVSCMVELEKMRHALQSVERQARELEAKGHAHSNACDVCEAIMDTQDGISRQSQRKADAEKACKALYNLDVPDADFSATTFEAAGRAIRQAILEKANDKA